ncbi:hypothetical protein TPHA_0M00950 [Tetrapisispora phaffii CBS 4417]|uniref:DNA-binding protein REB1 n=1 Tax=Tetrapisispora phaffii (strain ATCC 24235 / CBS 4417 / NBRC 1672 / NRRL Y-8282 / UCD 70-5) TaxID=1071381 RepID=G8C0F5_TETPH|nr:hypothetical protein TPHA_0M00950 [Tetrapisispora phaffii CBS 4417]CCE65670.1 hypothetical protein TPHA_0M00950 [Tetrapisispora phaffii CBS 4417]
MNQVDAVRKNDGDGIKNDTELKNDGSHSPSANDVQSQEDNVDAAANNLSDVDWFLKNEALKYGNGKEDIESGNKNDDSTKNNDNTNDNGSSSTTNNNGNNNNNNNTIKDSIARAAVAIATAFGSDNDRKKDKHSDRDKKNLRNQRKSKKSSKRDLDHDSEIAEGSSEDEDEKVRKKLKSIRNEELSNQLKDDQDSMVVDPELATLDEVDESNKDELKLNEKDSAATNSDVELNSINANENLVRKAIIESDSISQNPDFQQYLNTDGGDHDNHKNKKLDLEAAAVYAHAQIASLEAEHKDIKNNKSNKESKQEYREVLPKDGESADYDLMGDMSELINSAAAKASETIPASSQTSGKSFDSSEESALEQFVDEYQKIKGMTRRDVCERIWSNERRKDDFWINICKVLPYRTRSSIYKHVRRKYHIFEQRGKWNAEEEKELAKLCVEKEGQWSEIGKALGRMPEDCRDRWRNYVKCGPNRSSHKWSAAEETQLKEVIEAILNDNNLQNEKYIQEQSDQARDRGVSGDALENLIKSYRSQLESKPFKDIINWTIVSEKMGGTRSRIQCRYKWNKLMRKEALEKVDSMSGSDKKWILQKLADLGFTEDSQVDWEELAALKPDLNLNGSEVKLSYEKMRSKIKNIKDKTINDISKELLVNFEDHFANK